MIGLETADKVLGTETWTSAALDAAETVPYHTPSTAGPSVHSPSNHSPHLSNQSEEHTPEAPPFQVLDHTPEAPPFQVLDPFNGLPSPSYRSTSIDTHVQPRGQENGDPYSSAGPFPADDGSASYASLHDRYVPSIISSQEGETLRRRFPLEDPQEACLFRYFVEEIAHWVSPLFPLYVSLVFVSGHVLSLA